MSEEINLYLAPQSDVSIRPSTRDFYVDDKDLVCRDGAVLPLRCIKTNVPITEDRQKSKTLYWMNSWFYLLIFVHLLVLIIVHFIVRKRVNITFGISKQTRNRRALQVTVFWLVFFASLIGMFVGIALEKPTFGILGIVALLASLVALLRLGGIIRARRYDSVTGEFSLRGCCPEFLAQIAEEQRANPIHVVGL